MVFRPACANFAAACKSNVDLPIPGSPPTKSAEAGTSPPPKARSSSIIPLLVRSGGASVLFMPLSFTADPRFAPIEAFEGPEESPASSEIVFHSPHASHRPDHLLVTAPQIAQEKDFVFAMLRLCQVFYSMASWIGEILFGSVPAQPKTPEHKS